MASINGKSLKLRSKLDIHEEFSNPTTHGGCLGHFTSRNMHALNPQRS